MYLHSCASFAAAAAASGRKKLKSTCVQGDTHTPTHTHTHSHTHTHTHTHAWSKQKSVVQQFLPSVLWFCWSSDLCSRCPHVCGGGDSESPEPVNVVRLVSNLTTSTSLSENIFTFTPGCIIVERFHFYFNEPTSVSDLMRLSADINTLYQTNYITCTEYSCLPSTRSTQVALLEVRQTDRMSFTRLLPENTSRIFSVNTRVQVAVDILLVYCRTCRLQICSLDRSSHEDVTQQEISVPLALCRVCVSAWQTEALKVTMDGGDAGWRSAFRSVNTQSGTRSAAVQFV